MKIAILSRNRKLYSTRKLVEAAEARGHVVRVIDVLRCYMNITPKSPGIHYRGGPLEPLRRHELDAVDPAERPREEGVDADGRERTVECHRGSEAVTGQNGSGGAGRIGALDAGGEVLARRRRNDCKAPRIRHRYYPPRPSRGDDT